MFQIRATSALAAFASGLLACSGAFGLAPRAIQFQGIARTGAGAPVAGPINVDIQLWDAPAAGVSLFGPEAHAGVPVGPNGGFQIPIGSIIPGGIPNSALETDAVYVGIRINGDPEMTPRVRLASVPYVLRVTSAELDDAIDLGSLATDGTLRLFKNGQALPTIVAGGATPTLSLFTPGVANPALRLSRVAAGGALETWDSTGATRSSYYGSAGAGGGLLNLYQKDGKLGMAVDGDSGGANGGGFINLYAGDGMSTVLIDGQDAELAGTLTLRNNAGNTRILLDGQDANGGGRVSIDNGGGTEAVRLFGAGHQISTFGSDGLEQIRLWGPSYGEVRLNDQTGNETTVVLSATANSGGNLSLYSGSGTLRVNVDGEDGNGGGGLSVRDADGTRTVYMVGAETPTQGGQLILARADGTTTITLDGDFNGDGRIITQELQITGGSDLSEQFTVSGNTAPAPGMVVCIDPTNTGHLLVSGKAYDRTVAGVMSGAGGVKPGMLMGQKGTKADGDHPVALTGRVYVWCDASSGAISAGDLLTSSDTPGHAMAVADHVRAQGAIIGKAMGTLAEGKGLVLALVTLQ